MILFVQRHKAFDLHLKEEFKLVKTGKSRGGGGGAKGVVIPRGEGHGEFRVHRTMCERLHFLRQNTARQSNPERAVNESAMQRWLQSRKC